MEKKIEYWIKHQELDKFNFSHTLAFHLSLIALLTSICAPVVIYFATKNVLESLLVVSFVWIVCSVIVFSLMRVQLIRYNQGFRIREAMLRTWYQQLGVNTDLLDTQFEEIKEKSKIGVSENKQLEIIAKEVISKSNKKKNSTRK